MSHTPPTSGEVFNELDPHGFEGHGQHASHVIVAPITLRAILAILLVLTVATVGLAQAEVWAQNYFHIELPWWVNVAVAMSIAVVKALLVMGFFMQLKYDNPINTVLMAFTFGALACFLLFTGLDLFNRGQLNEVKVGQVVAGGSDKVAETARIRLQDYLTVTTYLEQAAHEAEHGEGGQAAAAVFLQLRKDILTTHQHAKVRERAAKSLEESAEQLYRNGNQAASSAVKEALKHIPSDNKLGEPEFQRIMADATAGHGHAAHDPEPNANTPNRTRPRTGLTDALSEKAPEHAEGGHH